MCWLHLGSPYQEPFPGNVSRQVLKWGKTFMQEGEAGCYLGYMQKYLQ